MRTRLAKFYKYRRRFILEGIFMDTKTPFEMEINRADSGISAIHEVSKATFRPFVVNRILKGDKHEIA